MERYNLVNHVIAIYVQMNKQKLLYQKSTKYNSKLKQVVKVIWHKAASPPHMDGSVVLFRWRQCAPHI